MSLGLLLRRYRVKHKLSIREAAEKLGVFPGNLSRYEGDENIMSFEIAIRISEVYKIPLGIMKKAFFKE